MVICDYGMCSFVFNDTATTWIDPYFHPLSLHDALPILIRALGFEPHFRAGEQLLHADMRRVADRLQNRVGFHRTASISISAASRGVSGGSNVFAFLMLGKR